MYSQNSMRSTYMVRLKGRILYITISSDFPLKVVSVDNATKRKGNHGRYLDIVYGYEWFDNTQSTFCIPYSEFWTLIDRN